MDMVFGSWAQGYISGVNVGMEDAYFDLGAKTYDEMLQFLRKYCNDRPLANFGDAATEFAKLLPRRMRKDDAPAPR
jgi:hypothetical protein